MSTPDGRTPSTPDVDQPDDGTHAGESELEASGRPPGTADVDTTDDGAHAGDTPQR